MHKSLAKENKKALVDLDIQNRLKGNYYSTHRIPALSEYSRQMMRDQSSQNSRALLKNLQNYEANSPFFERPELIAPVYERSITSADLSVDPNSEEKLWGGHSPNSAYKSVLYRQQANNGITRIGNQIYETPIRERMVSIENRDDLNPEKAHDLEEAHKSLIHFGNPL